MQLMKVIPVTFNGGEELTKIEFKIQEQLELSNSNIHTIEFELRSPSGSLLHFVEQNNHVYVHLKISKVK